VQTEGLGLYKQHPLYGAGMSRFRWAGVSRFRSWVFVLILCVVLFNCQKSLAQGGGETDNDGAYYDGYDDSAYYDEGDSDTTTAAAPAVPTPPKSGHEEMTAEGLRLKEELRLREEEMERKRVEMLQEQERRQRQMMEEQLLMEAAKNAKTTYKKSVGGGLGRVSTVLATERFVNQTAVQFGCLLQSQIGIKLQAKNATKVQRSIEENAKRNQEEFGKVVLPPSSDTNSKMAGASVGVDGTATSTSTSKGATKEKKLTYRELQEQKREKRAQAEFEKEALKGKFLLGASCETLICGSCKAMVEEFASAVVQGLRDPQYTYVDDVLTDFCKRKEIAMKYSDLVGSICFTIQSDKGGYRDALLLPFENDDDWPSVRQNVDRLNEKKRQICSTIGACTAKQLELQLKPSKKEQEHWDDQCYVCQAFARDLEERVQISKGITESNIVGIVVDTCNRLALPSPALRELCKPLTEGKLLDDLAWIAKVHSEALLRQARGEVGFPDKMCEEIRYCQKYVDPEELKKLEEQNMEQVFF